MSRLRTLVIAAFALAGCARAPSPLWPALDGSIGMTRRSVLAHGRELPRDGDGYHFLRDNGRHWVTHRFARVLERAAMKVSRERPGAMVVVGDASQRTGGQIMPHFSHRSGRDAD